MADNVYLLETRLSLSQQAALSAVREVARQHGLTVFLVGGAVRDLISGSPVRDLDVAIQGNALSLRSDLERAGGTFSGEAYELEALYLRFPGGVRLEVGSTLSASYPKPGQPVYQPTSILEDLRRRDFTANAMALSLNDGSYGLLMDPLNGVADIENRELRLVSNYGFIEDPVRMIRGARLMARLGWRMDERTQARYEAGKEENYIAVMRPFSRAYELEELFHEEDPLRVMRRLEEENWLHQLSSALAVSKANAAELSRLREVQMQFQTRGIVADTAAANFALLTAKVSPKEIEEIRASFPRTTFIEEIAVLDASAKEIAAKLLSKEFAAPSAAFQYLMKAPAATVVYTAYSSRSTALQNRLKSFLSEWPTAQSRVPYGLMQEMRITPELPDYPDVVEKVIYAVMDGKLETAEAMRAFLEPFSPPAPPPPVSLRRPRAPRKEAKSKSKKTVSLAASARENEAAIVEAPAPDQPSESGAVEETPESVQPKRPIAPKPADSEEAPGAAKRSDGVAHVAAVTGAAKPAPAPPGTVTKPKLVSPSKSAQVAATASNASSTKKSAAPVSKSTPGTAKVASRPSPSSKPLVVKQPAKAVKSGKGAAVAPKKASARPTSPAKNSSLQVVTRRAAKKVTPPKAAKKGTTKSALTRRATARPGARTAAKARR